MFGFHYKEVETVWNFGVQGREFDLDRKNEAKPWKQIQPEVETARFIKAVVDDEQCRNSVFCAVVEDKENGITRLEKPERGMRVQLRVGNATIGNENVPAGIYPGECFRLEWPPDGDHLLFELHLPESQISQVFERLAHDPAACIAVGVHLLSFGYEVDDALREPWRRQTLFIEDNAPAPVAFVNISSSVGVQPGSQSEMPSTTC